MFERGKLVTSLFRAAALVAGAVILTPFCAFADSVPVPAAINFTVTSGATTPLFEGGAVGVFVLTVENISPAPIVVKNLDVSFIAFGGLDPSSDKIAGLPVRTADNCIVLKAPKVLLDGQACTFTFNVTSVGNEPPENSDFGLTQFEFMVGAIPAPPLIPTVTSRSALADFRVEDVPVPEPATLTLFAIGAFCLTALVRIRRGNRETT
jgi:hypothetical protein